MPYGFARVGARPTPGGVALSRSWRAVLTSSLAAARAVGALVAGPLTSSPAVASPADETPGSTFALRSPLRVLDTRWQSPLSNESIYHPVTPARVEGLAGVSALGSGNLVGYAVVANP